MAMKAQGTQLYFVDPADKTVKAVEGVRNLNPGGSPADQIETTPLEADTREYLRGLRTPGQGSFTLDADPRKATHVRLYELYEDDTIESLDWAIGWSDGKGILPKWVATDGVASATVTAGGTGYTSAPTVAFTGGAGTGAAGTAVVENGAVVRIDITNPGSGYTSTPTIALSGGGGTGAAATAVLGTNDWALPATRTWFTFKGYVADFPFDFQSNATVSTQVGLQRSGAGTWTKKAAA